ncbi:MAG: DUF2971 domain-containing protein [Deltaproteobacteria bacterium]|nr:DUF2971 domain-containing protein [Deltaproteobacteria bacterium]
MPVRHPLDVVDDTSSISLLERIPPSLYKYSGLSGKRIEWMRRLIVDSELYFARPSAFNDPLDCRIPPSYDASTLSIKQHWRRVAKRNYPEAKMRSHKRWIQKIVMDSKTPEGQERLTKRLFKSLDKHGMACFAKDPTNMLLWSYYAEGHSGIAIRFSTALEHLQAIPPFIPVEVQYATEFPQISYYQSSNNELLATIFGTKSTAWKHEEEWRLVLVNGSGCVRMPPAMIDGVIMGMRIDSKSEDTLHSWVDGREPAIELLRVAHRPNSFELELTPAD